MIFHVYSKLPEGTLWLSNRAVGNPLEMEVYSWENHQKIWAIVHGYVKWTECNLAVYFTLLMCLWISWSIFSRMHMYIYIYTHIHDILDVSIHRIICFTLSIHQYTYNNIKQIWYKMAILLKAKVDAHSICLYSLLYVNIRFSISTDTLRRCIFMYAMPFPDGTEFLPSMSDRFFR